MHVFAPHLPSVARQIESREVVWVAHTEVDDIHQVGRHMHNYRRRDGGDGWGGGMLHNAGLKYSFSYRDTCLLQTHQKS